MVSHDVLYDDTSIEESCSRILRVIEDERALMQMRRAKGIRHAVLVFALLLLVVAISEVQHISGKHS